MSLRQLLLTLVLCIGCTGQARSPAPPPASPAAERELVALEYRWAEATKARDDSTVGTIIASDWYLLGPHGNVISRAAMLGAVRSNTDRIDTTEYFDVRVHVFNGVAALTGGAREVGTRGDGRRYVEPYRWMDVFAYRDGRWQAIVSQATLIPPP